ncbi:TetR/AcrR family transcriptional regulator [Flaviflagellibacter deserti]|uniref:TetR/AcrR family transcriptional regulator n=1 Tax=Flaviflagellibacter deserti TaxID=2267266 RepID=A0ABV9YXR8_9HYPH
MERNTREDILAAARLTVQAHGYNALSFRELGKEVGIRSASIHHHFPTKGDLGAAIARRYTEEGEAWLGRIAGEETGLEARLANYVAIFRAALENGNRMCLCGIMAAEYRDLPEPVRAEVGRFIEMNVDWLRGVLADAGARDAGGQALAIFAAIEGAQLVARGREDIGLYDRAMTAYREAGLFSAGRG